MECKRRPCDTLENAVSGKEGKLVCSLRKRTKSNWDSRTGPNTGVIN